MITTWIEQKEREWDWDTWLAEAKSEEEEDREGESIKSLGMKKHTSVWMYECRIKNNREEKGWKMKENVRTKANKRLERRRSMGYGMVVVVVVVD